MKKNHTDFLRKISSSILDYSWLLKFIISSAIIISVISFSLTLDEILEKSKIDPDFAWDMYLSYISQINSTLSKEESEQIEKVGRKLNAKRKLKDFEFALYENVPKLIEFLKSSNFNPNFKYYILEIFGEENLMKYMEENFNRDIETLVLFNVLSIDILDTEYVNKILNVIITDKLSRERFISVVLPRMKDNEKLAKVLLQKLYSEYSRTLKQNKETLLSLYREFRIRNYTHDKFEAIVNKTNVWYYKFFSTIINFFSNLFGLLGTLFKNLLFFIVFIFTIIVITLLVLPIIRYRIFYALGLKRYAAATYRKIVDKDPLNEEKRLVLAQLYEEAGMYEEAMNEYNFLKRIKIE
ncbi:tetratricopeptide repeat protein [Fervidobacterium sp.]